MREASKPETRYEPRLLAAVRVAHRHSLYFYHLILTKAVVVYTCWKLASNTLPSTVAYPGWNVCRLIDGAVMLRPTVLLVAFMIEPLVSTCNNH